MSRMMVRMPETVATAPRAEAPAGAVAPDGAVGCVDESELQPLVGLLRRAEDRFVAEFDARMAQSEFCSLSLAHSRNVLRHLGAGPRRASQLVGACEVSKQAVSQQIAHLERAGYLTSSADPADARARIITLTPRGQAAQQLVHRLFAEIEAEWSTQLGEAPMAGLRAALTDLTSAQPGSSAC